MSITLCIDQGNTSTKAAIFNGAAIIAQERYEKGSSIVGVEKLIEAHQPEGVIICSVVHDQQLLPILRKLVKHIHLLTDNSRLPIMNAYGSPETLGLDRIALAVGAQAAYPDKNVMAISCGTCITYNFVQKNKAFRGGAISPGVRMRFQALNQFTDKLPLVEPEGDLLLLGYDTETGIRSGVLNGIAAEIDGIAGAYAAQYGDFNAVLTGGDASLFANKLKNKIFADPDLLMKGLNLILKHNVPQLS
jgi:type III pantothenate kinase